MFVIIASLIQFGAMGFMLFNFLGHRPNDKLI